MGGNPTHYKGYLIRAYFSGGFWIEKGNFVILNYAETIEAAKAEIDKLV